MTAVELILALEEEMELVPLCRKGWWVAFGAPRPLRPVRVVAGEREALAAPVEDALADEARAPARGVQRAGTVPPGDPRRRDRRDPQPPAPRPTPDPAPPPVPEPPATPDLPPDPRSQRGRR